MDPQRFQQELLQWYDQSKRILPWRDNPNPYHVWISEIMLQQTRVDTVIPYFHRFIEALPTIEMLSQVDDDQLNKLWEGLGYYSRVRNIKQAAIQMMERYNGAVPSTYQELISLKGIGPYTAGAILSIAFNQSYTAVDGNVLRVFSRLLLEEGNIKDPAIKKRIKQEVETVLPSNRVGDFNQALMEIGATVCLPNGAPLCMICPLHTMCQAFQQGRQNEIPIKQPKKARRQEQRTVLVIESNDKFYLEQRPPSGLLAGLYQFPNSEGHLVLSEVQAMYPNGTIKPLQPSKHIFSHIEWHMIGYHITLDSMKDGVWATRKDITNTYSIPTAFKTYKNRILKGELS